MPEPPPSSPSSTSPAWRRPGAGSARASSRCSPTRRPRLRQPPLVVARPRMPRQHVETIAAVDEQRLGAPDAIAVRADRDRTRILDRADLARGAGFGTQVIRLDPGMAFGTGTHPTTRMCLRWIARAAGAAQLALGTRARLRLRLRHAGDRRRDCSALRRSRRSTSIRRPSTRRGPMRRPTGFAVRAGEPHTVSGDYALDRRQHPGDAAQAPGAAACGASRPRRRRSCSRASSSARPRSCATPTRPGSRSRSRRRDDGWILMTGARRS